MRRILVVDDDDNFRNLLRDILQQMNYEVVEARNGHEAILLYDRQPADVILTDIIMPGMEGMETILEFRRRMPRPKIICMSGGGRSKASDLLSAAQGLGAGYVLAKPFTQNQLATALAVVFGFVRREEE